MVLCSLESVNRWGLSAIKVPLELLELSRQHLKINSTGLQLTLASPINFGLLFRIGDLDLL